MIADTLSIDQSLEDESGYSLDSRLAPWIRDRERSLLRQMVATVARPGVLSLAGGLPDAALFPVRELEAALGAVLHDDPRALQYSPAQELLKERVVELMRRRGVECGTDQILLTSGAQQAFDIVCRALLVHRGSVALEELTYPGALQAIAPLEPRIRAIRSDLDGGLDVDHLESLLRSGERPAFLYLIPDAHNPLGSSLAAPRRARLVELALRYRLPLVEDDPYGLLAYDGPFAPPLVSLDPEHVLYLGSFSKILAPGLRLGWLVGPASLIPRLSTIKEASDLEVSGLYQRAVARLLATDGWLDRHLDRLRSVYRERRDAMLAAVARRFEGVARWTRPGGGMFVWLELQRSAGAGAAGDVDTERLLQRTLEDSNVAFLPGRPFAATTGAVEEHSRRCLRLSFSSLSPERIEHAVGAIADALPAAVAARPEGIVRS